MIPCLTEINNYTISDIEELFWKEIHYQKYIILFYFKSQLNKISLK